MNPLFILCLAVRYTVAYIAKTYPSSLKLLGLMASLIAIGFAVIYLFDLRPTGLEAGGRIWWNDMRPIHSGFYALFSFLAFYKPTFAWTALFADAVFGTLVFGVKYSGLSLL
jgi:hypothetical protein